MVSPYWVYEYARASSELIMASCTVPHIHILHLPLGFRTAVTVLHHPDVNMNSVMHNLHLRLQCCELSFGNRVISIFLKELPTCHRNEYSSNFSRACRVETCGRPFIVGLFSHLAIYNSEIIASPSFNLSSRELLIFKGMTRVLDLIRLVLRICKYAQPYQCFP
jgi:hypothetical protein